MSDLIALNFKYADYCPELVFQAEIESIDNGQPATLLNTLVNPEMPVYDYHWFNQLLITDDDIQSAPTFIDLYDDIEHIISGKTIFYHMPCHILALKAMCDRYNRPFPKAEYVNTEKIVRRVWTEFSKSGYGLGNLRKELGIPSSYSSARATLELLRLASEKTGLSTDELIEWSKREKPREHSGASLSKGTGNPYGPLYGETVVFTGILDRPRAELRDMVMKLGCNFADTLTREATILVVGTQNNPTVLTVGKSGKTLKAEKYNREGKADIQIMSGDDFFKMIELLK